VAAAEAVDAAVVTADVAARAVVKAVFAAVSAAAIAAAAVSIDATAADAVSALSAAWTAYFIAPVVSTAIDDTPLDATISTDTTSIIVVYPTNENNRPGQNGDFFTRCPEFDLIIGLPEREFPCPGRVEMERYETTGGRRFFDVRPGWNVVCCQPDRPRRPFATEYNVYIRHIQRRAV